MFTLSNSNITHLFVFIVGICCYTALTITGHDGTAVLTATLGYTGGAFVEKKTANGADSHT